MSASRTLNFFPQLFRCAAQSNCESAHLTAAGRHRFCLNDSINHYRRYSTSRAQPWTWNEIRIPTPYGFLAAKAWGLPSGRPILALHGWQDNANSFDLLIPLLKPVYRVIALDFMGHGYSSHLPPGVFYSPNNFLLDVQRVADYFGWEKFSIIGHSMGGGIGHAYSMILPDRLQSLVTIDVPLPATMTTDRFVAMTVFAMLNLLRVEQEHFGDKPFAYPASEVIAKHMAAIKNAYTEDAIRILMQRGCTQVGEDQYVFNRDRRLKYILWNSFDATTSAELAARYKNEYFAIRCLPLQFDRPGFSELQKVHKNNCSRYKYAELEGLHHIHMTNAGRVASLIDEFLEGP